MSVQDIPGPQLAGLPAFAQYHDAIVRHVRAAGAEWGQYLAGSAVISVRVALFPQANLPADNPQLLADTPSTFRDRTGFVRSENGTPIVEFAPAYRIRTGQPVDVSGVPDVTIRVGEQYLKQTLYFDVDPLNRTGAVPAGKTEAFGRFVHELGHALGFNGYYRGNGTYDPVGMRSTFDRYITSSETDVSEFEGLLATQLYGGPVPLTTNQRGHLGSDTDPRLFGSDVLEVMNGKTVYPGTRYAVSALDVAVLCDIGVPCVYLAANGGPDRTAVPGAVVTLDGSGTHVSGPTSFAWTQIGGTPVALSNANTPTATFIAPAVADENRTLTFRLTVTKQTYVTADTVTVTVASVTSATGGTRAVEYYNAGLDHYFVTSLADEIGKLDDGTIGGWVRTGSSFGVFAADAAGYAPVCRFFSASFAPKSSHFYSPFRNECDIVMRNPDWQFEATVFAVALPDAGGNCAQPLLPLYRLYNNGQGGAPNHRYTIDAGVRAAMIARSWVPEGDGPLGVIACVPQ